MNGSRRNDGDGPGSAAGTGSSVVSHRSDLESDNEPPFQAGLLACGSFYSPRLPRVIETPVAVARSERNCRSDLEVGFRHHLQRRVRDGFSPSSLRSRCVRRSSTRVANGLADLERNGATEAAPLEG